MRRRIAGNVAWMLLDRGTQVVAGIAVVAILARTLGTDGFAAFQYAQSLVFLGSSVALICGGEVVIPRLVALADRASQHRLLAHVFRLRILAALAGYLLVVAFLMATDQPPRNWWPALILGGSILLREPFGVVVAWMQSRTQTRPGVCINVVALALKVGIVVGLASCGQRATEPYAAAFLLEAIVAAALLCLLYRQHMPRFRTQLDPELTRSLLHDGALFWVSFILMMGARRIDQLILHAHVGASEFAAYAATVQITDNFSTLATILASGIAPLYVYGKSDAAAAIRSVLKLAAFLFAMGLAGATTLAMLAPWIVELLYGSAFTDAIALLRLAILVSPLVFADVGFTILAAYLRRPRWIVIKWGIACAATVIVDLIAIPELGARGAILGYAVSSTLAVLAGICMWVRARTLHTL
ncbi:oligosaccharide flippase family protein [Cupriavidus pauculus]|uniref:oligosaccharide flippase family protein n=1 Tax=Cupriavidus pauculus TaxID=82633 RepID=UPI001EE24483|nr:oligosaccharide flippase family protein [Cupriavidus pauculus]GJG93496.1 oligosaccharide flippase family protein [Cupriavidus pauculus]